MVRRLIPLALALIAGPAAAHAQTQPGTWAQRTSMPEIRTYHSAAESGGRLFVFGGFVFDGVTLSTEHSMRRYDPVANAWESAPGIPPPAGFTWVGYRLAAAVGWGDFIIQAGGRRHTSATPSGEGGPTTDCWKFDRISGTWTAMPALPVPLEKGQAAMHGSLMRVVGGTGTAATPSAANLELDLSSATPSWVTRTPIPTGTHAHQLGVIGNFVYLNGGQMVNPSGYVVQTNITRRWDPTTGTWTTMATAPGAREGAVSGVVGGRWFLTGGSGIGLTGQVWEYNPANNTWGLRATEPGIGTGAAGAVIARDEIPRLYVTGSNFTDETWEYTPPSPPVASHLTMKRPDGSSIPEGGWCGNVIELGATLSDPEGDAVSLHVELALMGTSFAGVPTATGPTTPTVGGSVDLSLIVPVAFGGAWRWQCRGVDSQGRIGDWKTFGDPAAADFNADLSAPGPTSFVHPLTDVMVGGPGATGGTVAFVWTAAADNSPEPLSYELVIDGPQDFTGIVSGLTHTVWLPVSKVKYTWQIRAIDAAGNAGPWSPLITGYVYAPDGKNSSAGDGTRACGFSAGGGFSAGAPALVALLIILAIHHRPGRRR